MRNHPTADSLHVDCSDAFRGAVLLLISCVLLIASALPLAAEEDINRIVLRVNDEITTLYDYEQRKADRLTAILANPNLGAAQRQEKLAQVGREVMYEIFNEMLLMSRAGQLGIRVGDDEIESRIRQIREQNGIESAEQMQAALADAGLTLDKLRANMKRDILWGQVVNREVTSQIFVEEQELRAIYRSRQEDYKIPEQRWLQEVIVLEEATPDADARQRIAEELLAELRAEGADFGEIVEKYERRGLTTGVIDLDWLTRDDIGGALREPAFELEPEGFSEPVDGRGGLHVLHLAGWRAAEMRSFDEVQDEILNQERGKRYDKAIKTFIADLEDRAYIRENLPPDAVGFKELAGDYEAEDELELFRSPELPKVSLDEKEG